MSAKAPRRLAEALLVLDPADDVGVARLDLEPGLEVEHDGRLLPVRDPVPRGHKIALHALSAGQPVRKYGAPIGVATRPIETGRHVHTHNLAWAPDLGGSSARGAAPAPARSPARSGPRGGRPEHSGPSAPPTRPGGAGAGSAASFLGFPRPDGRVGTRNCVGVVTSVNCSATVARLVADRVRAGALEAFPHVDRVVALTHRSGCGLPRRGEALALLQRTLRGYVAHPNFGAVLVLGLGCEVDDAAELVEGLDHPERPVRLLRIQETSGTTAAVAEAVALVGGMLEVADRARREPTPLAGLVVGLNCGGSDAWSGVTANPLLGAAVDRLVSLGGTAILAETPEVVGAEQGLLARAAGPEVQAALVERLAWWQRHVELCGTSLAENPSPGNLAGGITTIAEKALGAVAKGGRSPLRAVYGYAERVEERGLVFMDTPGFDPVSVTGILAGGANVVCFTTGRGSVFGCAPVPSIKLASTSELFERMRGDMDFDCGRILEAHRSTDALSRELLDTVVAVASGQRTSSEKLGFGEEEFAPWELGPVL